MMEKLLKTLEAPLAKSESTMQELEAYWASGVLWLDGQHLRSTDTMYRIYPYLFAPAFPTIAMDDLERLALAGRLLARSVIVLDIVMDRTAPPRTTAEHAARGQALQFEAYRILHQLFPASSPFWDRFRFYMREYAWSVYVEQRYAGGDIPWSRYGDETARRLAVAKAAICKVAIVGLAELAKNETPVDALLSAVDDCNFAIQLWDDLADWRQDLDRGVPSLVLARLLPEKPEGEVDAAARSKLSRRLYYGAHAHHIIRLAREALQRSRDAVQGVGQLPWTGVISMFDGKFEELERDIERIVTSNVERVRRQSQLSVKLPSAQGPAHAVALDATDFLIKRWRSGYSDLRHHGRVPRSIGIESSESVSGDIFQRAVAADAVLDVLEFGQAEGVRPLLEEECAYLVAARQESCGAWRYWPELLELPPDADTLAQVLQVVTRMGLGARVGELCDGAIERLLHHNAHHDGSFETWILAPEGARTREEERQVLFARQFWTTGADAAVVANLAFALHRYDSARFEGSIERALSWIEREQQPDGTWLSSWYDGPHYPTFACLRALQARRPGGTGATRAQAYLRDSQNADGGWGGARGSDPLSTALAAATLAGLRDGGDRSALERSITYLRGSRQPDGGWPAVPFLDFRSRADKTRLICFGSPSMTTAYVAKAAAMVHGWSEQASAETARGAAGQPQQSRPHEGARL